MRIHFWCPELFVEIGGIQRYSQCLLNGLSELSPNSQISVFVKHDSAIEIRSTSACLLEMSSSKIRFHTAGHVPVQLRTSYFTAQLLSVGLLQRPDLIITSHLNFVPVARILKQILNIPYWTSAHGIEAWDVTLPSLKSALQNADKILSVSSYTRNRLLAEQELEPSKVSILPNTFAPHCFGIAPKPDYLLKRYSLHADQPIIFTLGRLSQAEAYKGYDNILRALPAIGEALPNVHYILAGKGEDRHRLEALIRQLELENCVTLAGFVSEAELVDHYNLCNVFAMPSKGEGFGIVYLEALACGKPVLGGNQDGAIDALCNGEIGALVDPNNVTDIAHTLIEILSGTYPNKLIYQPERLRQRTIEAFGPEKFQQTLQAHLQTFFAIS